jgi:GAF domain-containing protein
MTQAFDGSAEQLRAQLAGQLADLTAAMIMIRAEPLQPDRVVRFAAQAVPASEDASLTIIQGSQRPQTLAGTSELPYRVDAIQYDTGQGPCLEALTGHDIARADDLATDPQWPRFAARAVADTGVRSMFGVRLRLDNTQRGALNFYARQPGVFTDLDLALGAIFATHASLALLNATHQANAEHLQLALDSNRQIGIAIGILTAQQRCTPDQAFDQLRAASQHLHRKLRDIAEHVTLTGELPDHP